MPLCENCRKELKNGDKVVKVTYGILAGNVCIAKRADYFCDVCDVAIVSNEHRPK